MSNFSYLGRFVFFAVISLVVSCKTPDFLKPTCNQNGNGNSCHGNTAGPKPICNSQGLGNNCGGKFVRATNEVQELLMSFDAKLTEEVSAELSEMNSAEKEQFLQDLHKMNDAAEVEYILVRDTKKSQQEIIQTVADKVSQDFKNKSWFKRLRSFAGDKIAHLVNNDNSDI